MILTDGAGYLVFKNLHNIHVASIDSVMVVYKSTVEYYLHENETILVKDALDENEEDDGITLIKFTEESKRESIILDLDEKGHNKLVRAIEAEFNKLNKKIPWKENPSDLRRSLKVPN